MKLAGTITFSHFINFDPDQIRFQFNPSSHSGTDQGETDPASENTTVPLETATILLVKRPCGRINASLM
jgi:hypothetical protein